MYVTKINLMKTNNCKTLLLFLLLSTSALAQWPMKPGRTYAKLGVWQQTATHHFTDQGEKDPNGRRVYYIPGLYVRTGVDKYWTMTGYVPLVYTSQVLQNTEGYYVMRDTNIGDVSVGVERLLYSGRGGTAFSAQLRLDFPSGALGVTGAGDGEFNQELRLLGGTSYRLFDHHFYLKGHLGFNNRTKGFSDELRAGIETGSRWGSFFMLMRLGSIQSLKNNPPLPAGSNAIFGDRIERTTLNGELTYHMTERIGFSFGYSHFLAGERVFSAPAISYGILYRY